MINSSIAFCRGQKKNIYKKSMKTYYFTAVFSLSLWLFVFGSGERVYEFSVYCFHIDFCICVCVIYGFVVAVVAIDSFRLNGIIIIISLVHCARSAVSSALVEWFYCDGGYFHFSRYIRIYFIYLSASLCVVSVLFDFNALHPVATHSHTIRRQH